MARVERQLESYSKNYMWGEKMEDKILGNKNYKYLLSLKFSNENDEQIIAILKEQSNIKEYIIQAIQYFEHGKKDEVFNKMIEAKLVKMEALIEEINRNTGM